MSETDPAVETVKQLIKEYPNVQAKLFTGESMTNQKTRFNTQNVLRNVMITMTQWQEEIVV